MKKKYVGFGLGAIQTGLFLVEAQKSGNFSTSVLIEVDRGLVAALRKAEGKLWVNIAHAASVERFQLQDLTVLHPEEDREAVIKALCEADEIGTAIPSVDLYDKGGSSSIAELLAEMCKRQNRAIKPLLIYTAENNNHAAEILEAAVLSRNVNIEALQILNTVVGKMSGLVDSVYQPLGQKLEASFMGSPRAYLVEAFNQILISKINLSDVTSAFPTFSEKEDLLPFEEVKLYGHNACHAWLAYRGLEKGYQNMAQVGEDSSLMQEARTVLLQECGPALRHRYQNNSDPIFSETGFTAYADDLLPRMVNPFLADALDRVGRDPQRKLARGDRLIGAAALATEAGIKPEGLLNGIRSALDYHRKVLELGQEGQINKAQNYADHLKSLWSDTTLLDAEKQILAWI